MTLPTGKKITNEEYIYLENIIEKNFYIGVIEDMVQYHNDNSDFHIDCNSNIVKEKINKMSEEIFANTNLFISLENTIYAEGEGYHDGAVELFEEIFDVEFCKEL